MPGILDLMEGLAAGYLGALAAVSLQEAGPAACPIFQAQVCRPGPSCPDKPE